MYKNLCILIMMSLGVMVCHAAPGTIDASKVHKEIIGGHLKMGNPGVSGKELLVNNWYLTIGGKPVLPVMGEFHYSRFPRDQWEDIILKMKASGINIMATYVFWSHHEELEGRFDWEGNKDLRYFTKLCQKHGLYVYPRIGPWCHGEVRNGGTPDWILTKINVGNRTNEASYQQYVLRWYKEIYNQLQGLLYKDNGPVIGIQLENEYRRGKGGEPHISWLKEAARSVGFDVPMYTITGWGNVSAPADEVIPLFGGYPEAPWQQDLEPNSDISAFLFETSRNIGAIGYDIVAGTEGQTQVIDYSRYPFFTCELGVGNQISQHRRPVLNPLDGYAIVTTKIGSGSNLCGYYVFAGGVNPVGVYTTLEEDNAMTGDYNDYPDISYDFQASILENGEIAPSYHQVKRIHYLLNTFGAQMAPMIPVYAKVANPLQELQWSVRVSGNAGFLFATHYMREIPRQAAQGVQFEVILPDETLLFPSVPVTVQDSSVFIWPFNFPMDGLLLKYATVQPLTRIEQPNRTDWFFFQEKGIPAELCFDQSTVQSIEAAGAKQQKKDGKILVTGIRTGLNNPVKVTDNRGKIHHIIVLSTADSKRFWTFNENGVRTAFLSSSNLYMNQGALHVFGTNPSMDVISLNAWKSVQVDGKEIAALQMGDYTHFAVSVPARKIAAVVQNTPVLGEAKWLKASPNQFNRQRVLFHKIFCKEFNLGDPALIRSAELVLATSLPCSIEVNNRWVNQTVQAGAFTRIDLTGYVQQGENKMIIDFPFSEIAGAFAGRLVVNHLNEDRYVFETDASWLTAESYKLNSVFAPVRGWTAPEEAASLAFTDASFVPVWRSWTLSLPADALTADLNNVFLHILYQGDKARSYLGYRLVGDNYNIPGMFWRMQLKQFNDQATLQPMEFDILPFQPGARIRFDTPLTPAQIGVASLTSVQVVPEYKVVMQP